MVNNKQKSPTPQRELGVFWFYGLDFIFCKGSKNVNFGAQTIKYLEPPFQKYQQNPKDPLNNFQFLQ